MISGTRRRKEGMARVKKIKEGKGKWGGLRKGRKMEKVKKAREGNGKTGSVMEKDGKKRKRG